MGRNIFCFIVILSGLFSYKNSASQSCSDNLFAASKLFDAGNTDACLAIVIPCSKISNDKSIRWQAFRLMSMVYLLKGLNDSARMATENLLEINPVYQPSALKDPAEFIHLINSITVIPKFSLGLAFTAGGNITFPKPVATYNAADFTKSYSPSTSFQAGVFGGYHFSKNISVHFGFVTTSKAYFMKYQTGNWDIEVSEKLTYLEVPLFLRYTMMTKKRWRPFVDAGITAGYLSSSENNFSRTWMPTGEKTFMDQLDSRDRRNYYAYGAFFGSGITYKIVRYIPGHLSLLVDYSLSFSNITNTDTRYNDESNFYNYYYIDDDLKLDNLIVSLGYTMYLNYKVIKFKR